MAGKNILFNIDTEYLIDSTGAVDTFPVHIKYGEEVKWYFYVYRVSGSTLTAIDVSDGITWEFAVGGDLDSSTDPWLRVLDANIDSSGAASGLLVVTIDTEQAEFLAAIDGLYKQDAYARLKGTDVLGGAPYQFMFKIKASADVDPNGGVPGAIPSNYYTKAESEALFEEELDGTQTALTDNATTSINIFDKTEARAAKVLSAITGTAGARFYEHKIGFFGSTAYDDGGNRIDMGAALGGSIVITSDISSDNVRLNFTLSGVGENLKLVMRKSQIKIEV